MLNELPNHEYAQFSINGLMGIINDRLGDGNRVKIGAKNSRHKNSSI